MSQEENKKESEIQQPQEEPTNSELSGSFEKTTEGFFIASFYPVSYSI